MKRTLQHIYLLLLILLLPGASFAQLELSAFTATGRGVATTFVTDYHAIGVNPANLGFRRSFRDPRFTVGFMEFNASFFSQALHRGELATSIFRPTSINLSQAQKRAAAERFANSALSINVDLMLFGASVSFPKLGGGLAVSIRDRIQYYSSLNPAVSDLTFLGQNSLYFPKLLLSDGRIIDNTPSVPDDVREQVISGFHPNDDNARTYGQILDGSRVSMSWFREYNLSYGQKVLDRYNLSVHLGAGIKILQGIALIDLLAEDGVLKRNNISTSKTFGLSFGDTAQVRNPSFIGLDRNASDLKKFLAAKPVGAGVGFDFGINVVVRRKLYLGLAVTNVGQISWQGNAYKLNDGKLREIHGTGLNNYNLLATSANSLQFAGDQSPLRWRGVRQIDAPLPSVARFGASYDVMRTMHFGIDIIVPLNDASGNLAKRMIALGGDYRINRLFRISSGVTFGGNQQDRVNVPLGIVYTASRRFYEAGIATRDITSYLSNFKGGSTISFSTGFLRFMF